ncbi:RBBP8 N-terminal-like protein isoform X2 [Labrus bergylta]|uniref:RBBP8 N-terminal-like protein isoform X2 n=1 Tax=Labrus bergylta TaxID=56723 RepID=UPI0033141454
MECFNSLLLKLKEVHEREVEGWQIKIQEMSSKKGCDTKRMEELFTKNQQMKEQQRLLTDNIKTLENRLRAGLCDRCTVTQEVAKRRQLEFESAQMQSLQHIALLAAEMNNLKKDNKSLREEIRSLRADRGDLTSSSCTEVKPGSSPDLSPSSAHITLVCSRSSSQPAGGDVSVKTETEQQAEETEVRLWRGNNRNTFDSYRPLTSLTLRSDQQSAWQAGERRPQCVEAAEQRPPLPSKTLPHKNSSSSSSSGREVTPSRHAVHPSVPCRLQPIRSSPVSLPWPLSESSDWVGGPGSGLVFPPFVKSPPVRFPNLIQSIQQGRKQVLQSHLKLPKEPTVLFRLRSPEIHPKTQEKKEPPSPRAEGGSADRLREVLEGPLDLSERGRSRSNESSSDNSERARCSPDLKPDPAAAAPPPPSSSCPSPDQQQDQAPPTDHIHLEATEHSEEEKKVPALTLSLRPVVVLENLNSALHKQESSSHSKSSSPAAETGSSCDGQDEEESNQRCRRKRRCEEMQTDRDSETEEMFPVFPHRQLRERSRSQ